LRGIFIEVSRGHYQSGATGESPLRPGAEALMEQRAAERRVDNVCHGECGWPVAGLLAEPFKDRVHMVK